MSSAPSTIVDRLLELRPSERLGARFIARRGEPAFIPYRDVIARAQAVAAGQQAAGVRPGERVAIVLPTGIEFLDAFLGSQLAGAIPAAIYPPFRLGRLSEYFGRTARMLSKIEASILITDDRLRKIIGELSTNVPSLRQVFHPATLRAHAGEWRRPSIGPEDAAFLQFSSGTTLEPKAVIVSHANLLANLAMIDHFFRGVGEAESEQGAVCWLPLYHDMGLLGCMFAGLYHPGTVTYIPPDLFVARPAVWLQTISAVRGVASPAPNFAYGLLLEKVRDEEMEGVDLSSWRYALNGAEPIDVEVMERFIDRYARWGFRREAMMPVYGLAEAGLAVSFSDPSAPPLVTEFDRERLLVEQRAVPGRGRVLPSVGRAMTGLEVEIHDPDGRPLPEGVVGTIKVRGASITRGYYNDPALTARLIHDGWLDTGDLGFFHGGQLYIAGRAKDLIIIRGRNYAPQEIEEVVRDVEGVRTGCAIAVGHVVEGEGEQLMLLAERDLRAGRPDEATATEIRERVIAGLGLSPYHVQLLEPGTLPRTSSGKMRRGDALRMFLHGELAPPERMGPFKLAAALGRSQLAWGRFWVRRTLGSK